MKRYVREREKVHGKDVTHLVRATSAGGCGADTATEDAAGAAGAEAAAEEGVQTFALESNRRVPRPDQADPPLPLDEARPACGCAMSSDCNWPLC